MPFVIRWIGEAGVTRDTVVAFGVLMLLCALSDAWLRAALARRERRGFAAAQGDRRADRKGQITLAFYVVAVPMAFVSPASGDRRSTSLVAALWLIPDRRFERLR